MPDQRDTKAGWTTGPIVSKKRATPPIVVDCSEWGQLLEVAATASTELDAPMQASLVMKMLAWIDSLDQAQKGSGFRKVAMKTRGREIVLTLAPIEPEDAKQRIQAICAVLQTPDQTASEAGAIEKLTARIAG